MITQIKTNPQGLSNTQKLIIKKLFENKPYNIIAKEINYSISSTKQKTLEIFKALKVKNKQDFFIKIAKEELIRRKIYE